MEGILAIIMIFGMPVFIVGITKYFKFRTARLQLEGRQAPSPEERLRITALEKDRALLAERVENLETIVTSVDLELNTRLNRLAAQQSMIALPPHGDGEDRARAATVAMNAVTGAITPGTELMDRYKIERALGHGGMGAVYLASDSKVGEKVALKVIAPNQAEDPSAVERFRREVGAARKITHTNVIRIHDLGEDAGLLFISMEYFPGMTLAEVIARRGALPLDEAREVFVQVLDALSAAHRAGVVHRDLKPQNILINERKEVRVIDFGLAKASYMRTMTATGLIMGTPEYMSPEQVRGRSTDHRSDIYALGAVMYHTLCGTPPFTGDSPIAVGFQHCSEPPPPPRQHCPDLPEAVEATILRCLAKDPAARPDTVEDVRSAL